MFHVDVRRRFVILLAITIPMLSGCLENDSRVAEVAQTAAERQARQNEEMARLNREVAAGARHLIESRGEADQQLLTQQQNLQSQRNELDQERRNIASERQRESIWSSALLTAGELAVCSLPLVLCWFLLARLSKESVETKATELLVEQLISESADVDSPASNRPVPAENLVKLSVSGHR